MERRRRPRPAALQPSERPAVERQAVYTQDIQVQNDRITIVSRVHVMGGTQPVRIEAEAREQPDGSSPVTIRILEPGSPTSMRAAITAMQQGLREGRVGIPRQLRDAPPLAAPREDGTMPRRRSRRAAGLEEATSDNENARGPNQNGRRIRARLQDGDILPDPGRQPFGRWPDTSDNDEDTTLFVQERRGGARNQGRRR